MILDTTQGKSQYWAWSVYLLIASCHFRPLQNETASLYAYAPTWIKASRYFEIRDTAGG